MRLKKPSWVLILALALAISASAAPESKFTPVPVKKLPKELVAVVKAKFPKGKITSAEKFPYQALDEGGFMGLTLLDGKKEFRVTVSCMNADYKINEISHAIAPSELPTFVMTAVRAKHPDAQIISSREAWEGLMGWAYDYPKPPNYYVRIETAAGEEFELRLMPQFKAYPDGSARPDPAKVYVESETPVVKAKDKQP